MQNSCKILYLNVILNRKLYSIIKIFCLHIWRGGETQQRWRSGVRLPVQSNRTQHRERRAIAVSSKLCCLEAKPRRWIPLLVTRFGVMPRVTWRFDFGFLIGKDSSKCRIRELVTQIYKRNWKILIFLKKVNIVSICWFCGNFARLFRTISA